MVTAMHKCTVLRWETALQRDLNLLLGAANYWKPWAIETSLLLYSGCCSHTRRHLPSAGLSLPRSQPWAGLGTRSLGSRAGWHHPTAQPLRPQPWQPIPAASQLSRSNTAFGLEGWGLHKFCLTTHSTQDQQFLKTKLSLCGCTILKTRLEVLPDLLPLPPQSTTLQSLLSEAAHKFWSDLASQNLMNMKVKTCFGTQTSLSGKWKDCQDFSKKL